MKKKIVLLDNFARQILWTVRNGKKGKGSPYSITEHRVTEMIAVLGSQPASDVSHKPGGRLPLLSARPAVTLAALKKAATNAPDHANHSATAPSHCEKWRKLIIDVA